MLEWMRGMFHLMVEAIPTAGEIMTWMGLSEYDVLLQASLLAIYLPFVILPMFVFFSKKAGIYAILFFALSVVGYIHGYYPYEFVDQLGLHRLVLGTTDFSRDLLERTLEEEGHNGFRRP